MPILESAKNRGVTHFTSVKFFAGSRSATNFAAASGVIFHKPDTRTRPCKSNIEMTPLCKIEVTHPRVLGSREVHRGGVVDEQAGVQPP